jgi:hypothetical protein
MIRESVENGRGFEQGFINRLSPGPHRSLLGAWETSQGVIADTGLGGGSMAVRQLAERRGSGIVVQLFWNDSAPPGSDLFVEYRDERQDVYYSLFPSRERALDAFHHPNAYVGRAEHAASCDRAAARKRGLDVLLASARGSA